MFLYKQAIQIVLYHHAAAQRQTATRKQLLQFDIFDFVKHHTMGPYHYKVEDLINWLTEAHWSLYNPYV